MNISTTLNTAADLIRDKGWGQGSATWYGRGGLCVEGAIGAAMGVNVNNYSGNHMSPKDLNFECPAGLAVREYLGPRIKDGRAQHFTTEELWLSHWNDATGRTAEEVIEVLRAVAVIHEAREEAELTTEQKVTVSR